MTRTAATDTSTFDSLSRHLLRADGQEDVCFALWHPSTGSDRSTALIRAPILPEAGERHVHGNASFQSAYFLRAAAAARESGAGLVLAHSHPAGLGWQGMSHDDVDAEAGHAPRALALTGRPLVGVTLAGDGGLSGRVWERAAARSYAKHEFRSVRVVGDRLKFTFHPKLAPAPESSSAQIRTVSAWGEEVQADVARLRVAIVGAGSVGAIVAEILARTGVGQIVLIDFDSVEEVNLDRLLHACPRDVHLARSKVEMLAANLRRSATNPSFTVRAVDASIVEREGFAAATACDVAFSCVDRPWARHVLNLIASAHLVPVVDGGISVRTKGDHLLRADWRAHLVAPGRRCLSCLGQYEAGLVESERRGDLDDPHYIAGLPPEHLAKRRENVFAFSSSVASMEVLTLLRALIAPSSIADVGAEHYHFVTGEHAAELGDCEPGCPFSQDVRGRGDDCGVIVTGPHPAAEKERATRRRRQRRARVRLGRFVDALLDRRAS